MPVPSCVKVSGGAQNPLSPQPPGSGAVLVQIGCGEQQVPLAVVRIVDVPRTARVPTHGASPVSATEAR